MDIGNFGVAPSETHEQFLQRASGIFPSEWVRNWSRIERAVFNQLMAKLIHQKSYGAISDAMLQQCRDEMSKIVGLYTHFWRSYRSSSQNDCIPAAKDEGVS